MKNKLLNSNVSKQIGVGFTSAAIIGSYSLAMASVLGLNLIYPLICCIACSFCSIKLNKGVFAPSAFFIVPLIYIFTLTNALNASVGLLLGSAFYLVVDNVFKKFAVSKSVVVGTALSLAIGGTIILTNWYFGIGAEGETIIEMLKSYRSLGFHPHFMGLLYGTITLFAMITYPFKFKKLNRFLPAEFITLLIPFIINLILNPKAEITAINEVPTFREGLNFGNIAISSINPSVILSFGFCFGILLFIFKDLLNKNESAYLGFSNAASGFLSALPSFKKDIREFSPVSAITSAITCTLVIVLFPNLLSRLPMHSIGAMLIVSLWRYMPYKIFKEAFKPTPINLFSVIISMLSFLLINNIFTASVIVLIVALITNKIGKNRKAN